MNDKSKVPIDPLIFQTAADMAAVWFETALSSGLPRGKYVGRGDKPIKMFVADHLEKFIPIAISILIDMLKPTSNCNHEMRENIYAAITNPVNDPDMMLIGKKPNIKNETEQMLLRAIKNFDKNKINNNIVPQSIIHNPVSVPTNLKGTTSLG
jgi:hypothetical protein